jgi:4-carboxymuconolactone decarboxylase
MRLGAICPILRNQLNRCPSPEGRSMAVVGADTHQTLSGVATGDVSLLEEVLGLREAQKEANPLDPRTFALVKIAALIAVDAPPASYAWQVGNALNDGVSPEDILATLRAIAPQVGGPKVVAAAPELMVALGLDLPENIG